MRRQSYLCLLSSIPRLLLLTTKPSGKIDRFLIGNHALQSFHSMPHDFLIAGMPSVLPEDLETIFRLNESTSARLQSISFFLAGLLVATVAIWLLWNFIARDTKILPRISLTRAACMVVLWGSLFVLVLTMISGARELLTPGAWKKSGYTYTLDQETQVTTER